MSGEKDVTGVTLGDHSLLINDRTAGNVSSKQDGGFFFVTCGVAASDTSGDRCWCLQPDVALYAGEQMCS